MRILNKEDIIKLLDDYKENKIDLNGAISQIKSLPYADLGYAKIDHHRAIRNGYPEVIYGEGKSISHIQGIVKHMLEKHEKNILCTRANREVYEAIKEVTNEAIYYDLARIVVVKREEIEKPKGKIVVVTGGTADVPVAEEAAVTAEVLGNEVVRLYDVGVAGMHRLLSNVGIIQEANVVIAVAGMEGALASVVGGMIDKPLIAVPTSVGYGANFGGVSALLCMLNSCASGVSVVNIDNGFGAAYTASMINRINL